MSCESLASYQQWFLWHSPGIIFTCYTYDGNNQNLHRKNSKFITSPQGQWANYTGARSVSVFAKHLHLKSSASDLALRAWSMEERRLSLSLSSALLSPLPRWALRARMRSLPTNYIIYCRAWHFTFSQFHNKKKNQQSFRHIHSILTLLHINICSMLS